MTGYIVLGVVIGLMILAVLLTDMKLDRDKENYKCYLKQEYRGDAYNFQCQGFGKACKHCIYRKNFEKEDKE